MNTRSDIENIHAEEREILERFEPVRQALGVISPVELVGSYPDTVIRMTATKNGQTDTREWSIWDGQMTGAPRGVGSGPDEYLQMLEVQVIYWLGAPRWTGHARPEPGC
jgi:hypothetical protein